MAEDPKRTQSVTHAAKHFSQWLLQYANRGAHVKLSLDVEMTEGRVTRIVKRDPSESIKIVVD